MVLSCSKYFKVRKTSVGTKFFWGLWGTRGQYTPLSWTSQKCRKWLRKNTKRNRRGPSCINYQITKLAWCFNAKNRVQIPILNFRWCLGGSNLTLWVEKVVCIPRVLPILKFQNVQKFQNWAGFNICSTCPHTHMQIFRLLAILVLFWGFSSVKLKIHRNHFQDALAA